MKINKRIWIFLISILSFSIVNAEVTFKAQKTGTILEGEKFQITFTLQGGYGENFHGPQLDNCNLISDNNVYQSSSTTYVNGKITSSSRIDYICVYYANKAGKINVPSVSINVNGKQYKSQPFSFEIQKNNGTPNQHITQKQPSVDDFDTSPQTINDAKSKTFIKIVLSKHSVYEQEPIECKFMLYTLNQVQGIKPSTLTLDGFLIEELPINLNNVSIEKYNGQQYKTLVLKHLILYPQKTGKLNITTGEYVANVLINQVQNIMGLQYIQQQSVPIKLTNEVSLDVKSLPSPRPTNFSGAVGKFSVSANISPTTFRTNETGTFTYTISGNGNVKYIKEPQISFPSEFELYAPKSNANAKYVDGRMEGSITFDYSFIPLSVGKYQIPVHEFVYFDLDKQEYVTLKTSPINIIVNKGVSSSKNEAESRNDIIDINLNEKSLTTNPTFIVYTIWYWFIYVIIIAIFITILIINKKKAHLNSNIVGLKLAKANKVAMKRLKLANEYLIKNEDKQFYAEIISALWGYLSDKLAIPTSQLIRDNISTELMNYGADEKLCNEVIDVLNLCDMAIYAPHESNEQSKVVYNRTIDIINKIESIKRNK